MKGEAAAIHIYRTLQEKKNYLIYQRTRGHAIVRVIVLVVHKMKSHQNLMLIWTGDKKWCPFAPPQANTRTHAVSATAAAAAAAAGEGACTITTININTTEPK